MTPLAIEEGVKRESQQLEESQAMTSYKLVSHLEPHGTMKRDI